jgi:HSP20 family protein
MLMRFDPFRELDRFADQMTRAAAQTPRSFPMDAVRRGEHFLVHLDLPGVEPSSINLTVERNALTVEAERRFDRGEGDEVLVAERPQGRFTRQLMLSDQLDSEKIEANYNAGVLTLTIPVAETAKPRRVEVTAGGGDGPVIEREARDANGATADDQSRLVNA